MNLDQIDLTIIKLLQQNARYTIKEIAERLHLSTTPVFERIKRLEKHQIIDRYVAIVNAEKIGRRMIAYVSISLKEHRKENVEAFIEQVVQFEEVLECHHITGHADFLLKVFVADIDAYNTFVLEKLSLIPHVGKVESSFALSVNKYTTAIPIKNALALDK